MTTWLNRLPPVIEISLLDSEATRKPLRGLSSASDENESLALISTNLKRSKAGVARAPPPAWPRQAVAKDAGARTPAPYERLFLQRGALRVGHA